MSLEMLGHPKRLLPLLPKDSLHLLVRGEPLLVLRVLELVLLEVGPQMLHHLRTGHLLLLHTEQVLQVLGQLQRFREAGSFWHSGAGVRSVWSNDSSENDKLSILIRDFIRDTRVSRLRRGELLDKTGSLGTGSNEFKEVVNGRGLFQF